MKRSEMLYNMQYLYTALQEAGETSLSTIMSKILEHQEEAGMAPPFYDKEQNNNGDIVCIPAREWEEE